MGDPSPKRPAAAGTTSVPGAPTAPRSPAFERDLALLNRWRDGDRDAGATLLAHYKALFHRVCLRMGVRRDESMVEIFQDVVLTTVRDLPTLPERIERSFAGWFAWQTRDAISRFRRQVTPSAVLPETLVSPGSGEGIELWEAIRRCSERLPPGERRVFELRYVQGMSLKEAADSVGSNANAVGQAIFRLSRRMRDCLSASGYGPEDE